MRFQKSGICWRNIPVPHAPFQIPPSTSNISHPSSHISHPTSNPPHSTFNISHSQHPSPPAKYLCLSSALAAQSVLLTSTPHGFCVDLWHLREKYSCAAWHIPHSAAPMRRTYSTFSTPLPQIYTVFPLAPRPASKYAILSASLQPPNNQPFTIRSLPRHLPNTPFPTTKRHLSTHDPCPFEAPSLTFRTSIPKPPQPDTCPTPASPLAYALSTRSNSPPNPQNLNFPPSVSPKIPPQDFHQISLPSALSPHRQDDPVECNGVGEEWPCAFPMLIHRRPSCRLEKFLVPLMVSSIQSSTFNHSFLQNLLISNRWFSTVCLSLLTLMYP